MKYLSALAWSLALSALFGGGASFAQTGTGLDVVLEHLAAAGRDFQNLEADIARTKVVVFVDVRSTDSGKVYFSGAGEDSLIRLTISEPAEQHLLVANGRAQLYRPLINLLEEHDLCFLLQRRPIGAFSCDILPVIYDRYPDIRHVCSPLYCRFQDPWAISIGQHTLLG